MQKAKRKTKIIITIIITIITIIIIIMQNLYAVCRLPCNVPINSSARAFSTFQRGIHFFPGRSLARHHVNDYVSLSGSRWRTAARTLAAAWAYEHICVVRLPNSLCRGTWLAFVPQTFMIWGKNIFDKNVTLTLHLCMCDAKMFLSTPCNPGNQPHS